MGPASSPAWGPRPGAGWSRPGSAGEKELVGSQVGMGGDARSRRALVAGIEARGSAIAPEIATGPFGRSGIARSPAGQWTARPPPGRPWSRPGPRPATGAAGVRGVPGSGPGGPIRPPTGEAPGPRTCRARSPNPAVTSDPRAIRQAETRAGAGLAMDGFADT